MSQIENLYGLDRPNTPASSLSASLDRVWVWLTEPVKPINNEEASYRYRLVAGTMVVALLSTVIIILIQLVRDFTVLTNSDTLAAMVGVAFGSGVYFYLRHTRQTRRAGLAFILLVLLVTTLPAYMPDSRNSLLFFSLIPIMLTGMYYQPRYILFWIVALPLYLFGLVPAVKLFVPDMQVTFHYARETSEFLVFMSVVMLVFVNEVQAMARQRNIRLQQTNETLRQSEATLEQRVADRTRELEAARCELEKLYQEQVEITQKMRAADEVKSQFLSSMSHELRTPLNAILNFTEFVSLGMLGEINERQQDALQRSLESGQHLLSLINDVLDMTKIESGMMQLFVEDNVDVYNELAYVRDAAEVLGNGKPVRYIEDIDANLPELVADRRRVRQILLNLVSNAMRFTEKGTVTVSVKKRAEEVLFAIIDTGPGIEPKDQELIFEPFTQTNRGTVFNGGTGLGLAISMHLVKAHWGRLWLDSEPGHGAAFYFTLPVRSPSLVENIFKG